MSNSLGSVCRWSLIGRCCALLVVSAIAILAACSGNQSHNSSSPSIVATVAEQTKNPLPDLAAATAAGKPLYAVHCAMCHGDDGKGNGTAGGSLAARPTDMTVGDVVAGSDGKIYLAVKNGIKKDGKQTMPPAHKVTDDQIWQIVAYVRTLAKK